MTERTDADTSPVIDSEAPKLNCWEYKNCGRESTVTSTHELGVCPAAIAHQVDGSNSGHNGGRICWAIAGTLGAGNKTCTSTFSEKITDCIMCEFYQYVLKHEELFDIYPVGKDI